MRRPVGHVGDLDDVGGNLRDLEARRDRIAFFRDEELTIAGDERGPHGTIRARIFANPDELERRRWRRDGCRRFDERGTRLGDDWRRPDTRGVEAEKIA